MSSRLGAACCAAVGVCGCLALLMSPSTAFSTGRNRSSLEGAIRLSSAPVRASGRWRSYVLDSRRPFVYPKSVTVIGNPSLVENPNGLMQRGGGTTTIHSSAPGEVELVLDLGIDTGGRVEAGVAAGSGGPLELSYSEARQYLQPGGDSRGAISKGRNDDPDGRSDLITGPGQFRSPGVRGAERYVLISLVGAGSYSIDFVRVKVTHLRVGPQDYVGHFLSSSRLLNRIWYAGAYTLDLDTALAPRVPHSDLRLIDGAKRDRLVWIGDLTMESLAGRYTVRQMPALISRSISMFSCQQLRGGYIPMASDVQVSCGPNPGPANGPPRSTRSSLPELTRRNRLPTYTASWVIAVCDQFQFTGDAQATRRLLPVMRRAMHYFQSNARKAGGLFYSPPVALGWRSFDTTLAVDVYTNEVWSRALDELAGVESEIGSRAQARADRRRARRVQRRLRARFFDPGAGLFLDGTDSLVDHPQDANVEAVLSGTVRGGRAISLLSHLRQRLWTGLGPATGDSSSDGYVGRFISPYMSGWELIARLLWHEGSAASTLLTQLWGHMVDSDPGSTLWEAMGLDGQPVSFARGQLYPGVTSLAHGWSTAPTYALSAYVLGMRPAQPGWSRWLVEPQTIGLRFAQGQVGTPHGPLVSRWSSARRGFRLTVIGPAGSRGEVAVPLLGTHRAIARDGRVVWARGRPVGGVRALRRGGYVRFAQGAGSHTYAWATG